MFVMFVHLFMSFLHFLTHLLVHHHSRCYHARSQGSHRRHSRSRRWVWRGIGTNGLATWIPWLWHRLWGHTWRESWIPLRSSWGNWIGSGRKGRIDRWWMDRIVRGISDVRGIWIWPSIGIPHVQMFLSLKNKEDKNLTPMTLEK